MNLHFTKLPFYITAVLFAVGFISLFMVARNEKVGHGFQKYIKIPVFEKPSSGSLLNNQYTESVSHKNMETQFDSTSDLQEPLDLLSNFIKDVSVKHQGNMDLETLNSFSKLNTKLTQLIAVKTK